MNKIYDLSSKLQGHFDYFLDVVRIYLGIGLVIKGIGFLMNPGLLAMNGPLAVLLPSVPYLHIIGGAMLALGIFPRVAALALIPILFGAVFLVNLPQIDTLGGREGVEFSALVLLLLGIIAIRGAGPIALGSRWNRNQTAKKSSTREWLDDHTDLFADMIRIYLGVGLIVKGAYILDHRDEIFGILDRSANIPFLLVSAAHYVIPAHFVGGALLVIGLLTRWAAVFQLPALLGALFYIALPGFALIEQRQSLEFTALVFFLLSLIAIFGAGRYSLENAGAHAHAFKPKIVTANA